MNKKHLLIVPLVGIMVGISYLSYSFINHAQAAGFTVDAFGAGSDDADFNPGDGVCDTNDSVGDGPCTLRAAIEEVNALGGSGHTINFSVAGTITLGSLLPTISSGVMIDATTVPGASCDMNSRNVPVEIDFNGLLGITSNAPDVTIRGLTLYNAQMGSPLSMQGDNLEISCMNINTDSTGNTAPVSPDSNLDGVKISNSIGLKFGVLGKGNIVVGHNYNVSFSNVHQAYILGNIIGLNARTDAAILPGSQRTGIFFAEGSDIHIGGANPGEGNVISGHQSTNPGDGGESEGITMSNLDGVTIEGNFIGTDKTGSVDFGNNTQGIEICSTSNPCGVAISMNKNIYIGGSSAGQRNIISGNGGEGILFSGTDNLNIQGNYIGVAADGKTPLANQSGILTTTNSAPGAFWGTNTLIGGPNLGEGNVISGNDQGGIQLANLDGFKVQGNIIGLDETGLSPSSIDPALSNQKGIQIGDDIINGLIGGSNPGEGNIISRNDMGIDMSLSTDISVYGNTIGFLADGITAAGNNLFGLFIRDSDHIHIGSANNADRNYIGNSGFAGIFLVNLGTDITVIKNNIGVGSDDATSGPNSIGIANVNAGTGNALIQENNIVNSISDGVLIENSSAFGPIPPTSSNVSVIKNNISNNGGLGINMAQDLDGDAIPEVDSNVNLNDISDSDTGPNNYLNYPALYTITPNGANYDVTYSVDVPNSGTPGVSGYYHVEFFKNTSADGTAHGEGETYIGFQNINVNPLLGVPYYGTYLTSVPLVAGDVISSTITECTDATCATFRSTSEFGSDATIAGGTTALDYGSAPDTGLPRSATSYPTYTTSNGAYHIIDPATYLGSCIDADSGTVIPFATSPLTIGACTNDNDGAIFPSSMLFGSTHVIPVTTHGAGVLNVWVDWNQNGDFENSERITTHAAMVNGANTFSLTIPAGVGTKTTYARVRFTSDASKVQQSGGVPSPYGEALDGEVEDYVLNLTDGVVVISVTPPTPSGGGSSSSGIIATCRDPKASNYQTVGTHNPLLCTYSSTPVTQPKTTTLLNTGTPTTLDQKACPYFTQYLKSGARNSKVEVTKWQNFLNEILGLKLKVNGTYDKATVNAVNQFQVLFASDILTPWGLKKPTGYTYKTTRMKANQMVNCLESSVILEGSGNGKTWVLPALK